MDARTLKALKGSIKKWEGIVAGTEVDRANHNCPLCQQFWDDGRCTKCPVRKATGVPVCEDTPYQDWLEAIRESVNYEYDETGHEATDDETVMCAVLELEFLKGLLP